VQEADQGVVDLAAAIARDEGELAKAEKIRKTENDDFVKAEQELVDTIDTLVRAASVIRKATGGSGSAGSAARLKKALLQVAGSLEVVMQAAFISSESRSKLQALLQQSKDGDKDDDDDDEEKTGYVQPTAAAYTEHSTGIVDLLADLKNKAEMELSDLRKDESNKQHAYDMLNQSLSDAVTVAKRDKANTENEKNVQAELNAQCTGEAESQKNLKDKAISYLQELETTHEQKVSSHEAETKDRGEELVAIRKAIEILSGEQFQAAVSSRGVFVQQVPDARQEVTDILRRAANKLASIGLAQLAVRAQEDPFGKVKDLIKGMIDRLQKQAVEEAGKKAFCDSERKKATAKREDLSGKLENYSTRLEKSKADDAQLKQDISDLSAELAQMDQSMQEATRLRQEESAAYSKLQEEARVGLEGLTQAITVLKDYYGKERAHQAQSDSSTNVIAFLQTAQSDLIKQKEESENGEREAQEAFTKMSNEHEVNKASKSAMVKSKEQERARLGEMIAQLKNDVDGTSTELDATLKYLEKLQGMCVHKVQSFEERAAKMQQEIAALNQALEILENETAGGDDAPEAFLQRKLR
jgi:hypothetical protein